MSNRISALERAVFTPRSPYPPAPAGPRSTPASSAWSTADVSRQIFNAGSSSPAAGISGVTHRQAVRSDCPSIKPPFRKGASRALRARDAGRLGQSPRRNILCLESLPGIKDRVFVRLPVAESARCSDPHHKQRRHFRPPAPAPSRSRSHNPRSLRPSGKRSSTAPSPVSAAPVRQEDP